MRSVLSLLKYRRCGRAISKGMRITLLHQVLVIGCVAIASIGQAANRVSLYERIGSDTLAAVIDDYVQVLSSDVHTQRAFQNTNLKRIKRVLTEQLCELAGGPCKY